MSVICASSVCCTGVICPSFVHHLYIICPSLVHHLSIISPSFLHHFSIISPSFLHHLLVIDYQLSVIRSRLDNSLSAASVSRHRNDVSQVQERSVWVQRIGNVRHVWPQCKVHGGQHGESGTCLPGGHCLGLIVYRSVQWLSTYKIN